MGDRAYLAALTQTWPVMAWDNYLAYRSVLHDANFVLNELNRMIPNHNFEHLISFITSDNLGT